MSVNIKIENFQGPFDLLLHLIKKNEMDIYDIKINEITEQYLQVLRDMEEMDLEVTSEFIVIAATLIEIKSRHLLPKPEEDEIAAEIDPSKQLVEKLVEYKKYKVAAAYLAQIYEKTGVCFSKKPEVIEEKNNNTDELLKNKSIAELYDIFLKLMEIYKSKINVNATIEEKMYMDTFKIEDKMKEIDECLMTKRIMPFSQIICSCNSKIEKVVTFLALLELIKLRAVSVAQENNFKEIYIERMDNHEEREYKSN